MTDPLSSSSVSPPEGSSPPSAATAEADTPSMVDPDVAEHAAVPSEVTIPVPLEDVDPVPTLEMAPLSQPSTATSPPHMDDEPLSIPKPPTAPSNAESSFPPVAHSPEMPSHVDVGIESGDEDAEGSIVDEED